MQTTADEVRTDDAGLDELDDGLDEAQEQSEGEPQGELEGGEGEGDETADAGSGEPAAPVRQQGRPGRRERQSAELRELRERSERLERELQGLRTQQTAPRVDPAEQARREQAEREQVAVLPLDQQLAYWRQKDRGELQQALINQQVQIGDTIDRSSWDARCATDPVRQRLSHQVEDLLRQERQAGRNWTREQIYLFTLGQETDRARSQQGDRQRREAQRRVRSQTTQPGGARSDAARSRRPADDSYEASLERVRGQALW